METLSWVNAAGRERLRPPLTNPNWLVLRKRAQLFQCWIQQLPSGPLSVLDIGGRIQPYRSLLRMPLLRYVALDIRSGPLVNVVGAAQHLPVNSGQFDLVLCSQVLEYVPDPQAAITEIHRVLKPGGVVLLSAPAIFPQDSSPEYWRFLPDGLRLLLSAFYEVEIAPEGYSISGILRTVSVFLNSCPVAAVRTLLRFTLIPALNLTGLILEAVLPLTNHQFSVNFSARARK